MTHARGGAAVIACGSLALLVGDAIYVSSQWHGLNNRFDRGFLCGVALAPLVGCAAKALCADKPIGRDRDQARERSQRLNQVLGAALALSVAVSLGFGTRVTL